MNSTVKKHSIMIGCRKTSISLEDDFWTSLQQIARSRQVTISDLIASLDAARGNSNLSSTIRVFILDHYRAMAGQSDVGITPLGAIPRAAVIVNPTAMDESMPRVLNYKRDELPPGAVYIGRLMPRYGLPGSKWHNPYKVGHDGTREEVIAKYKRHLRDSGLIYAVHELRGRDLVCWCASEPCHGDLLLRLANAAESRLPLTSHPPGAASRRGSGAAS